MWCCRCCCSSSSSSSSSSCCCCCSTARGSVSSSTGDGDGGGADGVVPEPEKGYEWVLQNQFMSIFLQKKSKSVVIYLYPAAYLQDHLQAEQ